MNFTEQQISAIEYSGSKLLISAAAGSGKTRVLVERILRKVESGTSISRFLIITYTNAAAAELRSRIIDAFFDRIENSTSERDRKYLRAQMKEAYQAQICTIDSFCQRILRDYSYAAGIRSDFRLMDESEAQDLQIKLLDDLLESNYDSGDKGFLELVDAYSSGRDDSKLIQSVMDTHGKLQSLPYPIKWLQKHIESDAIGEKIENTIWGQYIIKRVKSIVEYEIKQMLYAIQMISGDENAEIAYKDGFKDTLGGLYSLLDSSNKGWDAMCIACDNIPFSRLKALRNASQEAKLAKSIRDDVKKTIKERISQKYLIASSADLLKDISLIQPAEQSFYKLVLDFTELYSTEKRLRGTLDFSDLEHLALNILCDVTCSPTLYAREISAKYSEILVDEFQDINGVQDCIFSALNSSTSFVAVGDIKQSIYRFRRADPTIFLSYYNNDNIKKIFLPNNFRSSTTILNHVNSLFKNIMSPELGDMVYGNDELLRPPPDSDNDTPFENDAVQFVQLTINDGERVPQEASYVATLINSMLCSGEYSPSDFAILLRSPAGRAEQYVNALQAQNIPVKSSRPENFFERNDVIALISILEIIDNPLQDIPLIATLKLFGFTKNELSEIRDFDRGISFCESFRKISKQSNKFSYFANMLYTLRELSAELSVDELLRRINEMTGIVKLFSAFTSDAQLVFFKLLEYAKTFEANGYKGLYAFLNRLQTLKAAGKSPVDLRAVSSGNEVTVTSIHGSKGLEYKVVILADTATRFNHQDEHAPLLLHDKFGAGPKLIDTKRRITYPTLPRMAIAQKLSDETLSEEMRILYVAMTRAKQKLIMIHSAKKLEYQEPFQLPIPSEQLRRCQSIGEWLELFYCTSAIQATAPEIESVKPVADEKVLRFAFKSKKGESSHFSYYVPSKLTASELKGSFRTEESNEAAEAISVIKNVPKSEFRRPDFIINKASKLTASERGTALHLAMQNIDFSVVNNRESLLLELNRLESVSVLSALQSKSVARDADKIEAFFNSELGKRVLQSDKIHRELKFSLLVSAADLELRETTDKILLQGVADLCIENSDSLTLVDYKTDYVTDATVLGRAEYYRGQLKAYTLALSRMFNKPVTERYLYFFQINRAINISEGDT